MNKEFTVSLGENHNTVMGLSYLEGKYIEHVYHLARHNQVKAAKMLGISRGTLRTKLKQYFGDTYIE